MKQQTEFNLHIRKETLPTLKKLKLKPEEVKQEVCYLANLFLPFNSEEDISIYPKNNCDVDYWIKQNKFTSEKYGTLQFFIPQKRDWVVHPKFNKSWFSYSDILKPLNENLIQKKSPLLWVKRNEDSYERLFIVWW